MFPITCFNSWTIIMYYCKIPCLLNQKLLLVHALVHSRLDYCIIVFLRVCLGLLSSSYSLCWILLLVWFLAWSALITLHLPWWICIGFHTHSALHTNCVWSWPVSYIFNSSDLIPCCPGNRFNKYADDTYILVPSRKLQYYHHWIGKHFSMGYCQ